jgi:hypothetical protein
MWVQRLKAWKGEPMRTVKIGNFEAWFARPAALAALVASAGLCLSATGCVATSDYMIEPKVPVPTVAPPDAAVVVFVRPSHYGQSIATTILDDRGAFMGDSIAGTEFSVLLPPGPHLFLSWAENTAPLTATLLPGRVYYVEVSPRMGFWSTRVQLIAVTPRSENWTEIKTWMSESTQLVPDVAAGQAYLNGRGEDVAERIRRARERLTKLDGDALAERTLRPEDGVPSGSPVLVPVGAPPAAAPSASPPPPPPSARP